MVVETVKEKLNVNKQIAAKKEIIFIEGDMIVPDSKPDILNTICTSGVVCLYKKEVLDGKVRLDGSINTYIMYLADDNNDKVRGLNTSLDFSENINVPNCEMGMSCRVNAKLKSIECKVINGRKIGIKASLEVEIKVYSNEEIEIVNSLQEQAGIQMKTQELNVNSLVGSGETKIYAKETISISQDDNLAEILKTNLTIVGKDVKISYNKLLTKSELEVKMMYLTEDGRVNTVKANIPLVGFIDINNVSENNICDVDYEIKNVVIKPNSQEEHSVYIEAEVSVIAIVYEEKHVHLIQDLYSPTENLVFNKKNVTTITGKCNSIQTKQIREKVMVENLGNRNVIDVDIDPVITNEVKSSSRIVYEGELGLRFVLSDETGNVETTETKLPFDYSIDDIENSENMNTEPTIEITNGDFIVQENNNVSANVDIQIATNMYRNANLNVMDEVQTDGERAEQDYSLIIYIVKKGDTLWDIAKTYGSTVDDIVRTNGIEDENKIQVGQKLFIPKYTKTGVSSQKTPMINYA